MSFSVKPLAHVQVSIVEKALALAFSEVVSPQTVVLIIAPLLFVCTEVNTLAITFVVPDVAFVPITVVVVQDGTSLLLISVAKLNLLITLGTLRCALQINAVDVRGGGVSPNLWGLRIPSIGIIRLITMVGVS